MTIVDHLVNVALLGATWVLYLLFALSFAALAAMAERFIFYRRNDRAAAELEQRLGHAIGLHDEDAIREALGRPESIEAEVLRQAFTFRSGGPAAFADAIDSALAGARSRLDRSTTLLGTIGNNAPFVGLFGTVLGVIEAFSYLGTGDQAAMGNVMAGIAEALVATAVGIFVAIPAVVAFNVAQKRSGEIETRVLRYAKLVSAWLRVRDNGGRLELAPVTADDELAELAELAERTPADGTRISAASAGGR